MRREFVASITEVQRLADFWIIQTLSTVTFYIATYSGVVMEKMADIPRWRWKSRIKITLN